MVLLLLQKFPKDGEGTERPHKACPLYTVEEETEHNEKEPKMSSEGNRNHLCGTTRGPTAAATRTWLQGGQKRVCGFAVPTKTQRRHFQFFSPWDPVSGVWFFVLRYRIHVDDWEKNNAKHVYTKKHFRMDGPIVSLLAMH